MADKPDLNDLKEKFNIGGIVNSLKSMVNPASGTPDVDPEDDLGVKIAQISTLLKQMAQAQQQQVKDLNKVNEMLNGAFQDIELLRKEVQADRANRPKEAPAAEPKPAAAPETKKAADTEESATKDDE